MSTTSTTTYTSSGVEILFQSSRAGLDAGLTKHLIDFIAGTESTLDIAIYDLRHPAVLEALAGAVKRNIHLRLAYDGGEARAGGLDGDPKSGGTKEALAAAGLLRYATAVHEQGRHLMHDKFMVRDGKSIWIGSANFTVGGLELQDNTCLTISDDALAACYTQVMQELLASNHRHAHQPGSTPPPITVGGDNFRPYFEPASGDGIEQAIVAALQGAHKVRIAAFLLSDPAILRALLPYADAPHADIQGVYDPHGMQDVLRYTHQDPRAFWFLQDRRFVAAPSHGFSAHHEQDFMHNKVFVIDDHLTFTGSYNFSENARENDETVLCIESSKIATAYTDYIERLFTTYTMHKAAPAPVVVGSRASARSSAEKPVTAKRSAPRRQSSLDQMIAGVTLLLVAVAVVLAVVIVLLLLHISV